MPRQALNQSLSLSRRSLLRSVAATAGGTACFGSLLTLARAAAAPSQPVPLRLGLVTYNWGAAWDVPTLIDNCAATGFTGVELRTTHRHGVEPTLDARQREDVRRRFADSPVQLVGLGSVCEYHSPDPAILAKNIEETKRFVLLCKDVGGTGVKVRPNALPPDVPVEKMLEQIGRALNDVARHAADHGVQIRLEVHGAGTKELPNIRTIMDVADHPGTVLCWNCNPSDLDGAGCAANFDLVQDRLGTVHIHDLRTDTYPWADLFSRLRTCAAPGFTGWCLLEEGKVPADVVAAMEENHREFARYAVSQETGGK
jgi:sugar phosphate isomerase/epimerase